MQVLVQLFAGDPGLDNHIEILIVDLNDLVHLLHVDRNTAMQCSDVPLKCGASAVRDDRNLMLSTESYDPADFLGAARGDHSVRRNAGMKGLVLAKALTHCRCF